MALEKRHYREGQGYSFYLLACVQTIHINVIEYAQDDSLGRAHIVEFIRLLTMCALYL